jgi:hypothetical protein
MSKNAVARLLSDSNKGVSSTSGTDGMLARIFREFLVSHRLSFDQWERLIREYIKEVSAEEEAAAKVNGFAEYVYDKEHLTSLRTNLRNALAEKTMTWPTFVKGMRFFRTPWFDIEIKGEQMVTGVRIGAKLRVYTNELDRKAKDGVFSDIALNALIQQLLAKAGLGKMQGPLWEEYLDAFVQRELASTSTAGLPEGQSPQPLSKSVISSMRTSLKKNLSRDAMTWRTAVTSLRFLQLSSADIIITIYPVGKAPMVQELTISIDEDYQHDPVH